MTPPSPRVRLRCGIGRCREVLLELSDPPADWSAELMLKACPRHDTFRRAWWGEVARRKAKGLDPKPQARSVTVRAQDLRHMFYLADTTGRTQEDVIARQQPLDSD